MATQSNIGKFNNFSKGFITEANPLSFPEDACMDMTNFDVQSDGSLCRRLGMDKYPGSVSYTLGTHPSQRMSSACLWDVGDSKFVVTQYGNMIYIHSVESIVSGDPVDYSVEFTGVAEGTNKIFQYASRGNLLAVVGGIQSVCLLTWNGGTDFTETFNRIKVRDMFGVEDIEAVTGINLRLGTEVTTRPKAFNVADEFILTDNHIYNLRNQGWGIPRRIEDSEDPSDPISGFIWMTRFSGNEWYDTAPANSDSVAQALHPNPNDSDDRYGERFFPISLIRNPIGTSHAPNGYFIIDLFNRGASREAEIVRLHERYDLSVAKPDPVTNPGWLTPVVPALHPLVLPEDSTPGGLNVVASYAGRFWYSGIPSGVVDGDSHSPHLGSYVLYSRLLESPADAFKCHQDTDPTSPDDSELVDTDGGFIEITGASDIIKLVDFGTSLLVFARNGVWSLDGGSDYGFSATNHKLRKISSVGCVSAQSVVTTNIGILFFGKGGIYGVAPNDAGEMTVTSMTDGTIKSYYNNLSDDIKARAYGVFDEYDLTVRWLLSIRSIGLSAFSPSELVFDTVKGCWTKHSLTKPPSGALVAVVNNSPYNVNYQPVVQGNNTSGVNSLVRNVLYLLVQGSGGTEYTQSFCTYNLTSYKDWSVDDAQASLLTGYVTAGDDLRKKKINRIMNHFIRTENSMITTGDETTMVNPSSCIIQAQWDWSNGATSNKWGKAFEAYRLRRAYFSPDPSKFDNGERLTTTNNKIRGSGKALSLYLRSQPDYDCRPVGWSLIMEVNSYV